MSQVQDLGLAAYFWLSSHSGLSEESSIWALFQGEFEVSSPLYRPVWFRGPFLIEKYESEGQLPLVLLDIN